VIKCSLNPVWNEKFEVSSFDMDEKIEILIYDEDLLKMNDYMGKMKIDPSYIGLHKKFQKWFSFGKKSKILIESKSF
jgi:Ca2+-dependent lipid-binding protein